MKIDWKKLKAAIAADTKDIRKFKSEGVHGGALSTEKLQATRHCAIAAHARRHIHLSTKFLCNPRWISDAYGPCFEKEGMSLEEQGKFIEKELQNFLIAEAPVEVEQKTA